MITNEQLNAAVHAYKVKMGFGSEYPNLSAMRAALEDADAAAWRPIAEAPENVDLLVCVIHNLPDGKWEKIQWVDWKPSGRAPWPVYRERIDIPFPPTHYRPLPSPPTGEP